MKPRSCPACGTEVPEEFNFCPNCGSKIPEQSDQPAEEGTHRPSEDAEVVVCPTCGFQNKTGSKACQSCGTFLGGAKKERVEKKEQVENIAKVAVEHKKSSPKHSKHSRPKHSKRTASGQLGSKSGPDGKKFSLEPFQIAAIAAAILLGVIFVYGVMSSRSKVPSQSNSSEASQQQGATAGQPSADVLHEINRLREVINKNPADIEATLKLANMLQDNQMYDQAAIYYERYLGKNPKNVDARVDYGVTLFEDGRNRQALDELNRALKMDPKHQIGWFNLAVIYLNLGQYTKANDALKKCVKIDPNTDIGRRAEQTLEQHANIGNQEVK